MPLGPELPLGAGFVGHEPRPGVRVLVGRLPAALVPGEGELAALWQLHPPDPPQLVFEGVERRAPRYHQAYLHDYSIRAFAAAALPLPALLEPYYDWARATIDRRLDGLLVNWYDAALEHRIARHKDAPEGLLSDCPIVTISLGAPRTYELYLRDRPYAIPLENGSVIVTPAETNRRAAHAVPHRPGDQGRRISLTLRGFRATH